MLYVWDYIKHLKSSENLTLMPKMSNPQHLFKQNAVSAKQSRDSIIKPKYRSDLNL